MSEQVINRAVFSFEMERVLKLERENAQLRAMISNRDSEIMDLNRQIEAMAHPTNPEKTT